MKTIKLFLLGLFFFVSSAADAQISINVNIGSPPEWGPVGYDKVDYYYLPDIQLYYDIRKGEYIHHDNGRWKRTHKLPGYCRDYDLFRGYKVPLTDYRGSTPYAFFDTHKVKYYKGYKGKPQKVRGHYKQENKHEEDDHDHHDHGKGKHGHGKH